MYYAYMVSDSSTFNYTSIALKDVFSLNFLFRITLHVLAATWRFMCKLYIE